MVFLYHNDAHKSVVTLKGEDYKYIVKVRRHQEGEHIALRSLAEPTLLSDYEITHIDGRSVTLTLVKTQTSIVSPEKDLHIGWCVIDSKSVEKVLATLNELGVRSISFIYCARSQRNFKPDLKRYNRILEASNQQCGRSDFITFHVYKSLEEFLKQTPNVVVFDFCDTPLKETEGITDVLIGAEGGFSQEEKELLKSYEVFRLHTPLVLRSQSAVIALASKILL